MDHLHGTRNFSLQHLRFLVSRGGSVRKLALIKIPLQIIDEADRLLNQSFQDWLAQVLSHLSPAAPADPALQAVPGHDAVAASWYEDLGLQKKTWEGARPLSNNVSA